ncbi:MAG: EAL domain-containing protein [Candidatus Accumulibacter sp. UW20]|jgi:PAS domain S-box-containing protein
MTPLAIGIDRLERQLLGGLEQGSPWLTILDQAGLATAVVDAEFRFLRVNPQYARATGRTPDFFPGRHYFEVFPQAAIEAIFRQVRSSGFAHTHTARPFLSRSNPIPDAGHWNWSLTPFVDSNDGKHARRGKTRYLVLTMQEVSAPTNDEIQSRRAAAERCTLLDPLPEELPADTLREQKLAASEQRFRSLFNSLSSGFSLHEIILDANGKPCDYRFIDLNPAFEAITGLRREDIVGRCAQEVLPQIESRWIERFGAVALTGDCQAFDDFSSDLDRRYRVTAYRPAIGQFALIIDDITALHRGEESFAPRASRLDGKALTAQAIERMLQASHLRAAIEDGDLHLDYQPLVAGSGEVIGAEALLRWRDPERFLGVAEDRGLMVPLAAWLLASACRQMKTWLDAGRALRTVAVKLSPQQFFLQDLPELIGQTLAATGLEAHFLELDISARTLAGHDDQLAATLGRLRQLGVRLASDDFGSASASPTDLCRLPIDTLKIDRSFIRDIATDTSDAHIAAAIIAMARSLKLSVIATGVDSAAQFALLEQHGCDYYQGPLFGRPLPAEQFPEHCPVPWR